MKKKISLLLFVTIMLLTGCFNKLTPSQRVEDMLNRYIKNDPSIMEELDTYINEQDLSDEQKERYKKIIKDEYSSIEFTIKDEIINGDDAKVIVNIVVKDLYKASKEASIYLVNNSQEFYIDGIYNKSAFIDYKLKLMEENKDTIEYTIIIELKMIDESWTILEMDNTTLEKIHGIYDYVSD